MDATRGIRGGRWARAPRGRGRPHVSVSSAESGIRVSAPGEIGIGDGAPVQIDGGAEGRVPVPAQQLLLVDRDRLHEIVRRLVREAVVAARANPVPDPVVLPAPAPPAVQIPVAGVRSEGHVDRAPIVGQCGPLFFRGGRDGGVEMWLREIEGIFDMVAAPDDVRCRLAIGLLREDALASWVIRQGERPAWTYGDFKGAMLRDFSPPGVQIARETTFYRGSYDRFTPTPEVFRQFQRELFYCSHLCPTDASRIWILMRRLSPAVVQHVSSLGAVSYEQFLEVVLSYERQCAPSASGYPSSSRQGGKRPRAATCYGCHEEGHVQIDCPRVRTECYICHGRGHRAPFCQRRGGRAVALPHSPRVLPLRGVVDDHPAPPFTGMNECGA